jgi:hypothetical protein
MRAIEQFEQSTKLKESTRPATLQFLLRSRSDQEREHGDAAARSEIINLVKG